jgi:hypothetical protein
MALKVFDFECGTSGAAIVIAREPIMPLCANDTEIDTNIRLLKEDLDRVALEMKKAIRQQARKPDF